MLEGLDIELEGESDFTVARGVVVELKNANAEDIATTLSTLIEVQRSGGQGAAANASIVRKLILSKETGEELTPIDLDRPIRIIADKGTNAIIIFSTPDNNSALTEIAGVFDTPPEGIDIDVKSFPLKHANAEQVATMLKDMFDNVRKNVLKRLADGEGNRENGVMPPVSEGLAPKGLPYPVEVVFDARSNTVFIVGHSDAVLLAAGLINEMDKSSDALNVQPYVIPLKSIAVTNLKDQLEEVLSKRLTALGGDANAARDSAIITPDDRSNSLIVVATPEMYEMVADLAEQLDSTQSYRMVDSQFRQMEFADATKLAGMLQQVFDAKEETAQKTETQTKDTLKVLADSRSNSIVMTGTRDYLEEAVGLIDRLDQQMTSPLEVKVRPVVLNSAANIATLLEDMIQQARSEQPQEVRGMPIHIAADAYSNNLLLAASREDMQMLEAWIDVLDRPNEPGRVVKVIPLSRGDAEALAQSTQELFQTAAQGSSSDVTVTNDPTTNSVVAIGPPSVVHDIEAFVTKLNDTEIKGIDSVRVFALKQADAQNAGDLLRDILEGRSGSVGGTGGGGASGGSGAQDVAARKVMLVYQHEHPDAGMETLRGMRNDITVIDDLRTNSLVVAAPTESMALVESLIAAIDQPPTAVNVRMLPLYNSDAEQMVTMLDELFQTGGTGTGGGGGAAGGGAEPVIALGEGAEGGRQTLSFTTDVRTNSVIAAGTPGYLDLVEELVLKLDSQEMKARRTMVYQPRNNTALAIQQAIADFNDSEQQLLSDLEQDMSASQRMSRQIIAVASEDANRVLLSFDPRREQDLFDLVRDLDQPPPQVMIQVLIVEVSMDNSLELGVEFALQDLQFAKAGPTDTNTFDFVAGTDIGAAGTGLGGFTFTIGGSDFNFLFRTLQNEGSLNVLSRPQIVAMDNQEASIEIVNDVPFVTSSALNTGGNVVTQVDREEIGIKLTVTPQINPDGFVRMAIEQEVSDLTGSTVDVGQGVTAPIFFRRNANTTVTVMDGETVVLGGLITTRDETREQKVPLLGDIPGLGLLFRNDVTTERRTELLVILTPRVVRSVEDYRDLSIQERDRMTVISKDVLTNPMMGDLQVKPDELTPAVGGDMMGPFPKGPGAGDEEKDEDVYGPTRTNADELKSKSKESGSYDIPVTRRLSRAASAEKP